MESNLLKMSKLLGTLSKNFVFLKNSLDFSNFAERQIGWMAKVFIIVGGKKCATNDPGGK